MTTFYSTNIWGPYKKESIYRPHKCRTYKTIIQTNEQRNLRTQQNNRNKNSRPTEARMNENSHDCKHYSCLTFSLLVCRVLQFPPPLPPIPLLLLLPLLPFPWQMVVAHKLSWAELLPAIKIQNSGQSNKLKKKIMELSIKFQVIKEQNFFSQTIDAWPFRGISRMQEPTTGRPALSLIPSLGSRVDLFLEWVSGDLRNAYSSNTQTKKSIFIRQTFSRQKQF